MRVQRLPPTGFYRIAALFAALSIGLAQSPAPQAAPGPVIRIDVNLVQVDAVVTDSKGKRVTDLPASAFEIYQDGKPQSVTSFTYVSNTPERATPAHASAPAKPVKGQVPAPPVALEPAAVRRTMAFVVDEMGMSGQNIPGVKAAIRHFLDEQMRAGDLVAIIRTGAGMGSLQQFTTDKRLLYASLNRVHYGESRIGVSSFEPLGSLAGGRRFAQVNRARQQYLEVSSLAAIRFVVNSMRGLPGRKSLVLFTEDVRVLYRNQPDPEIERELRQINDAASRAAVVIHTIDPRGVVNYSATAADRGSRRGIGSVAGRRQQQVEDTEQGMEEMADQSGGLFLQGSNDLAGFVKEAAEDSDGYYLIGYRPEFGTFESRNGQPAFHKIAVKVKRAGMSVRTRDGFFGGPGGADAPDRTREGELTRSLQSPFDTASIHPRLTALFASEPGSGARIDALLYFDPKEVEWSREPDGNRRAVLDVAAGAFDENGTAIAPVDNTFAVQLNAQQYEEALKRGMVYGLSIPITKPGPYVVRAALRDPNREATGSAQQFVEIPNVASGRLTLSGITLRESAPQAAAEFPKAFSVATGAAPVQGLFACVRPPPAYAGGYSLSP